MIIYIRLDKARVGWSNQKSHKQYEMFFISMLTIFILCMPMLSWQTMYTYSFSH